MPPKRRAKRAVVKESHRPRRRIRGALEVLRPLLKEKAEARPNGLLPLKSGWRKRKAPLLLIPRPGVQLRQRAEVSHQGGWY